MVTDHSKALQVHPGADQIGTIGAPPRASGSGSTATTPLDLFKEAFVHAFGTTSDADKQA
eukprot:SAG31_NODE_11748_length_1001_cov_1.213969_3_plen_59_part_01